MASAGALVRAVRVVYTDGTSEIVPLQASAFGIEGTRLHGDVVSATLAERTEDADLSREDRDLGRRRNRLERSAA